MKKPIIILTGPTAVGKTKASIELAQKIGGEIISADSMQIYQKMDIGTAKITPEEMQGVPHHLVDILPVEEPFHVYEFQQLAKKVWKRSIKTDTFRSLSEGPDFIFRHCFMMYSFRKNAKEAVTARSWKKLPESKGRRYSMSG